MADLALAAADVGILQLLGDGDAHLLERGQGLLRRARGLFGAGGDLIAGAFQFLGGRRCLGYAGGQLSSGRGNAFGGLLLFGERSGLLALRFGLAGRYKRGLSFRWSWCCLCGRLLDECHGSFPFVLLFQSRVR